MLGSPPTNETILLIWPNYLTLLMLYSMILSSTCDFTLQSLFFQKLLTFFIQRGLQHPLNLLKLVVSTVQKHHHAIELYDWH